MEEAPKIKKHYVIDVGYDDPFPKKWTSAPIQARTHGRAIDFATRAFRKTRPKKREPKVVRIRSERIS